MSYTYVATIIQYFVRNESEALQFKGNPVLVHEEIKGKCSGLRFSVKAIHVGLRFRTLPFVKKKLRSDFQHQ